MSSSRSQRLVVASLGLLLLLVVPAGAGAAQSVAQELASTYSPILSLAAQKRACGPGEPYRPTSVDIVLGRNDVALRDLRGRLVTRAPSSGDLWGVGPGYYLDFPGDPLDPGCG